MPKVSRDGQRGRRARSGRSSRSVTSGCLRMQGRVSSQSRDGLAVGSRLSRRAGSPRDGLARSRDTAGSDVEALLDEIGIGLVDQLQPFLGGLVAAVEVGVVFLGQLLVAALELGQREAGRPAPAGPSSRSALVRGRGSGRRRRPSPARRTGRTGRASARRSRRPCRSARSGRCQVTSARRWRSMSAWLMPGEIVPARVELADMVEAEPLELAQLVAGQRRPVGRLLLAARPLAAAPRRRAVDPLQTQRFAPLVLPVPFLVHGFRWNYGGCRNRPQAPRAQAIRPWITGGGRIVAPAMI